MASLWHHCGGMQVRSLVRATRPDRQTLLFSATLPHKVKHLVREGLSGEVSVTVGRSGAANADVRQEVLLMASTEQKRQWLQARLPRLVDEGQVLVFVNKRAAVEDIVGLLEVRAVHALPACMRACAGVCACVAGVQL